jgi:RecB family exonuclease
LSTNAAVADDFVYARGAEMVAARRSAAFTRFDGNLAHVGITAPSQTSASRLERWMGCPFAYFLADVLGVEPVENPEDALMITPFAKGELVHLVLERFIRDILDQPPEPNTPWTAEHRARMESIAATVCADFADRGLTGRPIFWGVDEARIKADLQRFLDEDGAVRRTAGARPHAAELPFGLRGATVPAVTLPLPDGGQIQLRGQADRVDVCDDGTIHVYDYKTSRTDSYRGLSDEDPDLGGTRLQLPIYALAARAALNAWTAPVHAAYWFVTSRGKFERIGYEVTEEVVTRISERIQRIVEGIAHGVFPNYPTASSTDLWVKCPYCDPDALGVVDLQRRWERKQGDPALGRFLEMLANA